MTTPNATAIATTLRNTDTTQQGTAYLTNLNPDRPTLLAIAAALGLSRIDRLPIHALHARIIKQAIGDRRKHAGLRHW